MERARAAVAARMLEDFEARGVSRDLEELRAAWTPPPATGLGGWRGGEAAAPARPRGLRGLWPFADHSSASGRAAVTAAPALDRARVRGGALDYRSAARLEQLRALQEAARGAPSALGARRSAGFGEPRRWTRVAALGWGGELGGPGMSGASGGAAKPRADAWDDWEAQWEEQLRHFGGVRALVGGRAGRSGTEEDVRTEAGRNSRGEGPPRRPAPSQGGERQRPPPRTPPPPRQPRPAVQQQQREEPISERFTTFAAFDEAYQAFEKQVIADAGRTQLGMDDIPWPPRADVCGLRGEDTAAGRKKRVMKALLRFHPDKWQPLLGRVRPAEAAKVADKIREVTRSILHEKARHL